MKRMLFAGAVVLGAMSHALAADLPVPYTPPPPRAPAAYVPAVIPIYNWNGFYVGLNGGYGFGTTDWTDPAASSGNFNVSGGLFGGQIGWNYQIGQVVLGIEGDMDWSGLKGSFSTPAAFCSTAPCTTENNWLSTVRGRIGFAWDRVLVFGTAGGAFGNVKASFNGNSDNDTEAGWAAGAGVEVGITENITAKAEYLFVDLSNGAFTCGGTGCIAGPYAVKFDASIVRAGINLKFSGF
jgi:outer membrane immunogenic protein